MPQENSNYETIPEGDFLTFSKLHIFIQFYLDDVARKNHSQNQTHVYAGYFHMSLVWRNLLEKNEYNIVAQFI